MGRRSIAWEGDGNILPISEAAEGWPNSSLSTLSTLFLKDSQRMACRSQHSANPEMGPRRCGWSALSDDDRGFPPRGTPGIWNGPGQAVGRRDFGRTVAEPGGSS